MHCKTNGISSYCQIADYKILIEFRPDVSTRIKHLERLAPLTEIESKVYFNKLSHYFEIHEGRRKGWLYGIQTSY